MISAPLLLGLLLPAEPPRTAVELSRRSALCGGLAAAFAAPALAADDIAAARDQIASSLTAVDDLFERYDSVTAEQGGDGIRRVLGTIVSANGKNNSPLWRVDRAASPIPVEEETQTIEERPSIESFETGTDTFDLVEKFKGPAGASRDEVKALEKRLVEALSSVEGRLAELSASSSDMGQKVPELRDALTLLGSQLASMQHSKADRGKTERQLKSKVDRDEIDDIAARLAGDKDDDLDPTLVAKQQVPALKCLSCDRPLTMAPRTEAGIFPPAAYAGAAPSKVESLGRGPTPLDALGRRL